MTIYQHNHGIKVLSLFDGIGIGYLALKNLGVKVAEVGYHSRHHAIGNSWTVAVIEQLLMYVWMDWNYPDPVYPWDIRR